MKIIDLTHSISVGMPVYPGTMPPEISEGNGYEKDGFRETLLHMLSHTGTHMDAPNHLFPALKNLDEFPPEHFVGKAVVIDCSHKKAGESITMSDLKGQWESVERADFLLFRTDFSKLWCTDAYFGDYPVVDFDVIDYLIASKKKAIGLDCIGLDPIAESELPRHKRLLSVSDTLIIENLKNLDLLGDGLFTLLALPLKFEQADGAPVRVFAQFDAE